MSESPALPAMHHVGLVVEDVPAALADFHSRWGLTPGGSREVTFTDAEVDGKPETFTAHFGFVPVGETQIELIAPVSGRSPYARFLDEHGEGLHHLAFVVGSIDRHVETVVGAGAPCAVGTAGELPGLGRFVYLLGTAHGAVVELIEAAAAANPGAPSLTRW